MPQFRKKPVVIEALRFIGGDGEIEDYAPGNEPHWYRVARTIDLADVGGINRSKDIRNRDRLLVHTPEGVVSAYPGDWIIRGVEGEVYPCKPSVFEATYDPCAERVETE